MDKSNRAAVDRPKYGTLQSIDSANARVDIDGKVQTFAAKVRDERSPDEQKPPAREEVELNGKTFQCNRRTRQMEGLGPESDYHNLDERRGSRWISPLTPRRRRSLTVSTYWMTLPFNPTQVVRAVIGPVNHRGSRSSKPSSTSNWRRAIIRRDR